MNPTRRSLLAGLGAMGLFAPLARAAAVGPRRLVVVHAWGGWDSTFVLDPKPRENVDGPYVDEDPDDPYDQAAVLTLGGVPFLDDRQRRPAVTTFFANHAHRVTVINGVHVGAVGHHDGIRRILSGTTEAGRPDLPTLVGASGADGGLLGTVAFSGTARFGPYDDRSIRLGMRGQLRALLDPSVRYPTAPDATVPRPLAPPPTQTRDAVASWLHDRLDDAATSATDPISSERLRLREESLVRAQRLRDAGIASSLPLGNRSTLAADIPAALELLDAGVCRSVLLDSAEPWDSHANQPRQHGQFNRLFANLGRLTAGLIDRGMAHDTTVVVLSEMARSPRRNGDDGTEHWPATSALIIDPSGRRGGRVLGGTDDHLLPLPVDPHTGQVIPSGPSLGYDQLAAGLLAHCDVDPEVWLPGVLPLHAAFE